MHRTTSSDAKNRLSDGKFASDELERRPPGPEIVPSIGQSSDVDLSSIGQNEIRIGRRRKRFGSLSDASKQVVRCDGHLRPLGADRPMHTRRPQDSDASGEASDASDE
jgi:hypothetical protein